MQEKPNHKSKTVVSLCLQIVLIVLLMVSGKSVKEAEITMDNLGKIIEQQSSKKEDNMLGLGLLGTSAVALKGRFDADKRMKGGKDENE